VPCFRHRLWLHPLAGTKKLGVESLWLIQIPDKQGTSGARTAASGHGGAARMARSMAGNISFMWYLRLKRN